MSMDPVIREYLDARVSRRPEDWAQTKLDAYSRSVGFFVDDRGREQPFARTGPETIQLFRYRSKWSGDTDLFPDNSKTPEEVYAMLLRAAVDWKHGEALRMVEDERTAEYHDRVNFESIGIVGLRSCLGNLYWFDHRVEATEAEIEIIEQKFDGRA